MQNSKRKNNMIIGGLLAIVLVMGIGYAAFSSKLSINGTGSVSSNFDVKITGITSKNIVGTAGNKTNPTYTDTTATFYTTLQSPGDSITYNITVANNGTIDTVLNDITTTNGNNSAITFETSGLSKGDSLLKGDIKTLTVKVTYNSSVTSQPSNTTSTLKVSLNFIQKNLDSSGIATNGIKTSELKSLAVTTGDGLYEDNVTPGRYFYRGGTVNNYITFNNETWRIISIESDGTLKIIRNEQLSETKQWDAAGNRNSTTSTYCSYSPNMYGCSAWAATSNLVGNPSTITYYYPNGNTSDSTTYSGTVANDSTMATYLNGEYYNSLSNDAKKQMTKGIFNVSTPGYASDTESLETDATQEAGYQWKGYVALYTVTELLRASTNTGCTSLNKGFSAGSNCISDNWLWPAFNTNDFEWTLSPLVYRSPYIVWYVGLKYGLTFATSECVTYSFGIRPVLHLSSSIKLSGSGSNSDPYQIVS